MRNFAETNLVEKASERFVADVHLGKLAKGLRMAGFDVAYRNDYTNAEVKAIAIEQDRILLSRNTAFAKEKAFKTFVLESEDWLVQLQRVSKQFELSKAFKPFTRCLVCNSLLLPVQKEKIEAQLKENTRKYFNEFWQCETCGRIYWKGSHYERMEKIILQLQRESEER